MAYVTKREPFHTYIHYKKEPLEVATLWDECIASHKCTSQPAAGEREEVDVGGAEEVEG